MKRLALALALLPNAAAAHGTALGGDWIMAGFDGGLTVDGDVGALLGVEISYVEVDDAGPWIGVFISGAWLSAPDVWRLTIGPELGHGFGGVDLGLNLDSDGAISGRLRALGTLAVVSVYAGLSFGDGARGEFGVLLKAPIEL